MGSSASSPRGFEDCLDSDDRDGFFDSSDFDCKRDQEDSKQSRGSGNRENEERRKGWSTRNERERQKDNRGSESSRYRIMQGYLTVYVASAKTILIPKEQALRASRLGAKKTLHFSLTAAFRDGREAKLQWVDEDLGEEDELTVRKMKSVFMPKGRKVNPSILHDRRGRFRRHMFCIETLNSYIVLQCSRQTKLKAWLQHISSAILSARPKSGSKQNSKRNSSETYDLRIEDLESENKVTPQQEHSSYRSVPLSQGVRSRKMLSAATRGSAIELHRCLNVPHAHSTGGLVVSLDEALDARDGRGNTPLILAARSRSVDAVQILLNAGAFLNAKNERGESALMVAASGGSIEILQLLMRFSVSHRHNNRIVGGNKKTMESTQLDFFASGQNTSVLHVAARAGHAECVSLICEYALHLVDWWWCGDVMVVWCGGGGVVWCGVCGCCWYGMVNKGAFVLLLLLLLRSVVLLLLLLHIIIIHQVVVVRRQKKKKRRRSRGEEKNRVNW